MSRSRETTPVKIRVGLSHLSYLAVEWAIIFATFTGRKQRKCEDGAGTDAACTKHRTHATEPAPPKCSFLGWGKYFFANCAVTSD